MLKPLVFRAFSIKLEMVMSQHKIVHFRWIFYPFLAFLFGIVMARKLFAADTLTIVSVVLIFMALATTLFLFGKWKSVLLLVLVFFVGNGFYFLGELQLGYKDYQDEVLVIGRVSDKFIENENSYFLYLDDVYVNGEGEKNIYLCINSYDNAEVHVGDKLVFNTYLTRVKPFELGEFSNNVIRNDCGYSASINISKIEIIGNSLKFDEKVRLRVRNMLHENLSDGNAEICYAVLFGDKMGIDGSVKQSYNEAGILHVLTVSGLHIGFLISLIYLVLRWCKLGRLSTTIVTSIILLMYNIFCGFAPSVMRASIMAIIIMLAKLSGREYDNLNALGLAGFIIMFINPLYAYDIGFLMSFFSVATIFMLYPVLRDLLKKILHNKLADYIAVSIAAQLGIVPFIAVLFQNLNFLTFFCNLLVVPIFGFIYPLLFVGMIISLILPFLSKILVIFDVFLNIINSIAHFFAQTMAKVPLYQFDILLVAVLFIVVFIISRYLMVGRGTKVIFVSAMSVAFVLCAVMNYYPFKWGTSVSTIMDGRSNYLILTSDSGQRLLISDGSDYEMLERFCYRSKVRRLNGVVQGSRPKDEVIDFYSGYSAQSIFVCEGEENNIVKHIEESTEYKFGDFEIVKTGSDDYQFVEITFDGLEFCFASTAEMSYNELETFGNLLFSRGYDFVYFDGVCYYQNKNRYEKMDYQDGNYRYSFQCGKFALRGLD